MSDRPVSHHRENVVPPAELDGYLVYKELNCGISRGMRISELRTILRKTVFLSFPAKCLAARGFFATAAFRQILVSVCNCSGILQRLERRA